MSSENPPQPVSDTFNYSQWNIASSPATQAWTTYNFLSKRLNDTAQGIITFLQGIVTNSINATSSGATFLIGNNINAGNISIGANVNAFGSILLGGGLAGLSNIYAGYLNVTNLITNNITPIGVGDTLTVGASTSTLNVNSPTTFSQTVTANTIATTTDAASLSVASNQLSGHIYIGNASSRSGSINIGAKIFFPTANTVNIGNSSFSTNINGTVNIARASTSNIGTLSGSTVNIGSSGSSVSINSPANFTALPTVSASYFPVPSADTSNTIITANWINTLWFPYLLGTPNTWGGNQTFSTLPFISASYATVPGNDTSNIVVNTTFLNTIWLFYLASISIVWTSIQSFSSLPVITSSYGAILGSNSSTTVPTTGWINGIWLPYFRGLANTWSAVQTFTSSISLSAPISPNYSYPVASGLIGERVAGVTQSGTTTVVLDAANAQEDIATVDLTRGVWMITTHQTNPNVASSFQLLISSASGTRQNTIGEMLVFGNTNASNLTSINVCGTVSINASATYYAVSRTSNAGGATLTNVFMYAIRIA